MTYLTDAQTDARKKAIELLQEHFEHYVVIVETQLDAPGSEHDQSTYWCGAHQGHSASLGLLKKYEHQMLNPVEESA
jgi:hypothetical protein